MSFFDSKAPKAKPLPLVARCGACGLYKGCKSPKMKVSGAGAKKILVVGEAPGKEEDQRGEAFVGPAGARLRLALKRAGLNTARDCWFTNALICRPGQDNKIPDPKMVGYCRPNLISTIKRLDPTVVLLCGGTAVKSLVGHLWKEDQAGEVSRWVGWHIPDRVFNTWVCPTYHPSHVLRQEDEVLDLIFDRQVAAAVGLKAKKPWEGKPPDPLKGVRLIHDPDTAARAVGRLARPDARLAFDYETTCLKPDNPDSRIVCCSVSDGKDTIVFPWHGAVLPAMRAMLADENVRKIASNMKFEHRWTKAKLGVDVRGWFWDTMLAAHVLDNRPGIGSIKFQSYVLLGQPGYDEHVHKYLVAADPGAYSPNRVGDCDKSELMTYCGLDSLLEYKVAVRQRLQFTKEVSDDAR